MKKPNFLRRLALLSIASSALWSAGTFVPASAQNLRTQRAPRSAQGARLPASVRQMMPRGNLSLRLFRLAPAPKAPRYLVHLWTAPRRNPQVVVEQEIKPNLFKGEITRSEIELGKSFSTAPLATSPFVPDIFTDEKVPKYQDSLVYGSRFPPDSISLRYLNSKNKYGLIFQFDETFGPVKQHTFTALEFNSFPLTDTLYSYGGYGGRREHRVRRAADGSLEVIRETYSDKGGPPVIRDILVWRGGKFVLKK